MSPARPAVLACALALAASACGALDSSATAGRTACDPVEEFAIQGGEHLIAGQEPPVPYNSTPPTSGWHTSGAFDIAVQPPDQPLTEPQQVSVLEAGGVVISYHDLPGAERRRLEELVTRRYGGTVAVTGYDGLDRGQVAITAWGVAQRCDGVDAEAIDAFVAAHAGDDVGTPGH